jgi:hypothetical protein
VGQLRKEALIVGRHFYAHEHPELLVRDLQTMFENGAFGIVEGKTGYDD